LHTYHETLKVDNNFINQVITQFDNEDNWDELEQQLLNYDALNGPYYYQADVVYSFLELIYHEEQDWEKALNMLVKQTDYNQSISIWRLASEYAMNIGDQEKAIYYEGKAKEMADQGGSYFDKIFNVK
jgi:tetratricopeptide (TPR) repeat protein